MKEVRNKYCKCGNIIKNFYAKQCRKCYKKWIKILKNNFFYGKKHSRKSRKLISLHHADLNHQNTKKTNILKLLTPKHIKLHQRAYEYLVKIELIYDYIKWFDKKYKLNVQK